MKSKDKGKKYIKVTLKNIIICCSFAIIILCCISFYNYYFNKNEVYAKETNNIKTDNIKISNAQLMNLDEIVNNNTQNKQKEEYKVCHYSSGRLSWNYRSLYFCDEPL